MPCPDGHAFAIDDRADIMRMRAVELERNNAGFIVSLADDLEAVDL